MSVNSISVVLSAYNGSKYIEEQLRSINEQEMAPDEVLIVDDCSTDNTYEIVKKYISDNKLENWNVIKNTRNIGWKRSFVNAMQIATGDLIFLCDQDDIWHRNKISVMTEIMNKNKNILLLASNYNVFYENGAKSVRKYQNDATIRPIDLNSEFFYTGRPGCVYCYRKELNRYIEKYYFDDLPHDAFLWRISALLDGLYLFNSPLIDYRRHRKSATGNEKKTINRKLYLTDLHEKIIISCLDFLSQETVNNSEIKKNLLLRYQQWNDLRKELLLTRKCSIWFKLIPYQDCFFSKKTFSADLLMVVFYKKYGGA